MDDMFLSIIIPVYKVEDYLKQCIESVIRKNLDDIEIILVDDGSPDNSPQICDEYANEYSFIKVIHKKNGGLSSARNEGLKIAVGKYIMFLDSDDWWNPDVDMQAILNTVKRNESVEMFLLTSLDYIEGDGYYRRNEHNNLQNIRTDSVAHYYEDLLANGNLEVHAATKILKREFINKNSLLFKEGIVSEDNEWMIRLLRCLKKVQVINEPVYIYRAGRAGSITNSIKRKNIEDLLSIIEYSLEYCENNDNQLREYELCYAAYLWFSALGLSSRLKKVDKIIVKKHFESTSCVCQYSNSIKTRTAYCVYKLCGLNITTLILGMYISLKGGNKIGRTRA